MTLRAFAVGHSATRMLHDSETVMVHLEDAVGANRAPIHREDSTELLEAHVEVLGDACVLPSSLVKVLCQSSDRAAMVSGFSADDRRMHLASGVSEARLVEVHRSLPVGGVVLARAAL